MNQAALVIAALAIGCSDHAKPPADVAAPIAPVVVQAPADAAVAPVADAPPAAIVAAKEPGHDFIDDVQLLYRVVACGHLDTPIPDVLAHGDADRAAKLQKVIDGHCKTLAPFMDKFRKEYFDVARAWFVAHEPKDLPTTVVYAFGGGDLVSALVAFPDATDITTLSLELAGDPRKLPALAPEELDRNLATFRRDIGMLIWVGSNLSVNLSDEQRSSVAAQLSSHLLGLSTGGYEPVAVRFFALDDTGAVHYYETDEIDPKPGKSLSGSWKAPAFSQAFQNVEVKYRKIGETTVRVHRHIAWNLSNQALAKQPGVLAYLAAKGKVAVCVKGGSYLLWLDDFSTFRKYLLDHLAWMVADSTGIAPNFAEPAGMEQDAYGQFDGPVLPSMVGQRGDVSSRKKWKKPKDRMPFRFGYLDLGNHSHVMITRPKAP